MGYETRPESLALKYQVGLESCPPLKVEFDKKENLHYNITYIS
jgi:hypothetical protein